MYDENGNYTGEDVSGEVQGGGKSWLDSLVPLLQTGINAGAAVGAAAINAKTEKAASNRAENIGGATVAPVQSSGVPRWVIYAGGGVAALALLLLIVRGKR